MQHRREIDGLRALAVLPVIFFHAGFNIFSGGFVGVDVFFVISGYLITGLILSDTFSIKRFYARRARRILPALFVVMFICIPFAFFLMLPSQYQAFSESLIAVIFFISNILFWSESGYFAAVAAEKPLLHTWSLGVEEQFYIFFPLLLLLLLRFGRKVTVLTLLLITLISLGLCEYASRYYINANYFLIPTRAWELFIGALCALLQTRIQFKPSNLFSTIGIGLVLFAIFAFKEQMRLPSLYMLVPVLGAALILVYGTAGTIVGRLFSKPPLVGIGLISYSAYLWHQPLFAFERIHTYNAPKPLIMLCLIALTLILATLSWRFVEKPFRNKQGGHYVPNKPALMLALLCASILIAVGIYGHVTKGRLQYWNLHADANQVRTYALTEKAKQASYIFDNGDCIFRANGVDGALEARLLACQKKYSSGIAFIGDSHGMDSFFLLKKNATNMPFIIGISQGMCRPHSPMATCYYDAFLTLVERNPGLFSNVIYEQSGAHLFLDERGWPTDRNWFLDLPIDTAPNFTINEVFIDKVATYLTRVARHTRVTWYGPRIEPHIPENALISLGCDYPFKLRPKQEELYRKLDATIHEHLNKTPVQYRSQIELIHLDMAQDFMNCKQSYWKDGDHYSMEGADYFADRVSFQKLVQP